MKIKNYAILVAVNIEYGIELPLIPIVKPDDAPVNTIEP